MWSSNNLQVALLSRIYLHLQVALLSRIYLLWFNHFLFLFLVRGLWNIQTILLRPRRQITHDTLHSLNIFFIWLIVSWFRWFTWFHDTSHCPSWCCKYIRLILNVTSDLGNMIIPNNWLTNAFCRNMFNTLKLQRWCYFVDVIPKSIPMHEVDYVLIHASAKFVFGGPIDNKPAVGQIMTWRRTGGKSLFAPKMD